MEIKYTNLKKNIPKTVEKLSIHCKNQTNINISYNVPELSVHSCENTTIKIDCLKLNTLILENCSQLSVILYNVRDTNILNIYLCHSITNITISTENEENKIRLDYQCPLEQIHSDIIFDTIVYPSLEDSLNTSLISKQCVLMYDIHHSDFNELCSIKKQKITSILNFEPHGNLGLNSTDRIYDNLYYNDDNFIEFFSDVKKEKITIDCYNTYPNLTFKNSIVGKIDIKNSLSIEAPVFTGHIIENLYLKNVKCNTVYANWAKNSVFENCTIKKLEVRDYLSYYLRLSNCTIRELCFTNDTAFTIVDCTIDLLYFTAFDHIRETNLMLPPKTFKKCSMALYSRVCKINSGDVEELVLFGKSSEIFLFGNPKKITIDNDIVNNVTINNIRIENSNYSQIRGDEQTEYLLV